MANFVLQILSLTSLISSYSLSVLYLDELDGIKLSDYQLTLTGVCMTASHLAVSHASPLKHISARPQEKKKKGTGKSQERNGPCPEQAQFVRGRVGRARRGPRRVRVGDASGNLPTRRGPTLARE